MCLIVKQLNREHHNVSVAIEDERNLGLEQIIAAISKGQNVFITGGAGTGKSYNLAKLKELYGDHLHLTSTTGISAININGQTIHSWSGIGIADRPIDQVVRSIRKNTPLYQQIILCKMLAIDEISMLHSRIMDYINDVLKAVRENTEPFGGIQIILVGDFFQLPPISDSGQELKAKDFCFNSRAWNELNPYIVELKEVKRQNDPDYIELLNNIRQGNISVSDLRFLWERENSLDKNIYSDRTKLHLFSTNKEADSYNSQCLQELDDRIYKFLASERIDWCNSANEVLLSEEIGNQSDINDLDKGCRAPKVLKLKIGCRVMLLKNINVKANLANGSCGEVVSIQEDAIEVHFDCGKNVCIYQEEFELIKAQGHKATGASIKKIVRKQYPLRLAYGITIHKSQGMTFDELVVHCDKIFADGQAYVALSRTKSLQGLYPLCFDPNKVTINSAVADFYNSFNSSFQFDGMLNDYNRKKQRIIQEAISRKKNIKICYKSCREFHTGEVTSRIIVPEVLGYGENFNKNNDNNEFFLIPKALYLKGFCKLRNEKRIFMLDRIVDVEILDPGQEGDSGREAGFKQR